MASFVWLISAVEKRKFKTKFITMKKFFKWFFITLLVLTGLYLSLDLFAPSNYKVERNKTILAPADAIYPHISNLKNWNSWSAWARMDSTAVYTYEGTDGAVGSVMKWKGDPEKVGEGMMELTELIPNQKVSYKLTFVDYGMTSSVKFIADWRLVIAQILVGQTKEIFPT
jgi:hypothetical protein